MDALWNYTGEMLLAAIYVPKVFFLSSASSSQILSSFFVFPKRENGLKKGLQKDCKDLCVYIPEKGTKKSCEKKPVDDKILL